MAADELVFIFIVASPHSERSFWPAFQKCWAALLCEQTQGLSAWSEAMRRALSRGTVEVPNSADAHAALDNLNARLLRLQRVQGRNRNESPDDDATLTHFVRYGAALLSAPTSPANEASKLPQLKHEEMKQEALDYAALRLLLEELCQWLQLLKLVPRCVLVLEDFDSQILGRAVAWQLGVDFEIVNGESYARSKSLIVSADGGGLTAPALRSVFPGQVLYALNLRPEIGSIAPDVASLTQPELVLPWQDQRLSTRKIAGVVERISNAPLHVSADDWSARLEFYRSCRSQLTAGNSVFQRAFISPETR